MLIEELPRFVRESSVLSDTEKNLLTQIEKLPSAIEVEMFGIEPSVLELTNAFIGDETTRDTHLQELAKTYLEQGDILSAWKIILQ